MRVHDLIGAFYAIDNCRQRAAGLRKHFPVGAPARAALEEALAALDRFNATRGSAEGAVPNDLAPPD
jgi:hypothetical protein